MGAFDVAQVSNKQQAERLIATFEQEQKDIAKAQADLNKAAQEAKGNTKTLTEISNLKIELASRDKSIKGMVKTLQWMIKLNKYPGKK